MYLTLISTPSCSTKRPNSHLSPHDRQCGHCKALAPDWEKLANDWKGHKVGLVAEVDCTDPAAEGVCAEYQIEGFPTLMYGDPNSPEVRTKWYSS